MSTDRKMRQVPANGNESLSVSRGEEDPLLPNSVQSDIIGLNNNDVNMDVATRNGTGTIATFFNFAKASVGSGSFALSWGIMKAGVLVGSAGMILLGVASVYTMQLLLEVKLFIRNTISDKREVNYTEMGRVAMGTFGKWVVNLSVLGCNLGVCAGYMIFISSNLEWVFNCASVRAHHFVCFNTWEIYAILLPILILLTFLPSFKILAYAAYIGSIFLVIAMIVVYVYGKGNVFCAVENVNSEIRYIPETWAALGQWFGVTAYLFCVHSMVFPLESSMKKPSSMPVLLDVAAFVVVVINLPFAVFGYLLFGDQVQGYIFSNLPGNEFNTVVRALLSLELTLTFPIVIKPATEVMEEILQNTLMALGKQFNVYQQISALYIDKTWKYVSVRYAMIFSLRGFLVLVSWGVAVGIPRFELCLALVGGLATTILAFVLPPLFHLRLKWRKTGIARNIFHVVLLVVGILVTIAATSINLYMAIEDKSSPNSCTDFKRICNTTYSSRTDHCYETVAE